MTTLINIFASTGKNVIKIIREMWGQLIKAIKLLAFNPQQLSFVDLCKAVLEVLNTGVATVVGSLIYAELATVCNYPFGGELAMFCGALVTGVFTLGLNYFDYEHVFPLSWREKCLCQFFDMPKTDKPLPTQAPTPKSVNG